MTWMLTLRCSEPSDCFLSESNFRTLNSVTPRHFELSASPYISGREATEGYDLIFKLQEIRYFWLLNSVKSSSLWVQLLDPGKAHFVSILVLNFKEFFLLVFAFAVDWKIYHKFIPPCKWVFFQCGLTLSLVRRWYPFLYPLNVGREFYVFSLVSQANDHKVCLSLKVCPHLLRALCLTCAQL